VVTLSAGVNTLGSSFNDERDEQIEICLKGVAIAPGYAVGMTCVFDEGGTKDVPRYTISENEVGDEIIRFRDAVKDTRKDLTHTAQQVLEQIGQEEANIFQTHLLMLEDPSFIDEINNLIKTRMLNAETVVMEVTSRFEKMFTRIEDEYLKERAADVQMVGRRLLNKLMKSEGGFRCDDHARQQIVVSAQTLTSTLTVHLERGHILGFAAENNLGPTSHAAILARTLGVPAVVGLPELTRYVHCGDTLVVDGFKGIVCVNPSKRFLKRYQARERAFHQLQIRMKEYIDRPAETTDGVSIRMGANVGRLTDLDLAEQSRAEEIGLYRTEFPFMIKNEFPSEDFQYGMYRTVAEKFPAGVNLRLLDIGGDKFLNYFPLPRGENPYLSWRGLRLLLEAKGVLKTQLRAVLRASAYGNIRIIYPMVTSVEEVRQAKAVLEEAKDELISEGIVFDENIEQGAMIEVPAAVQLVRFLAEEVQFFSVGTNDLVQYTLAVDRNNQRMARFYDPLHPGHLKMLADIIESAAQTDIDVSICGEMASDPHFTMLLLGLGFTSMSMSAPSLVYVKDLIRSVSLKQCEELAKEALQKATAPEIWRLISDSFATIHSLSDDVEETFTKEE